MSPHHLFPGIWQWTDSTCSLIPPCSQRACSQEARGILLKFKAKHLSPPFCKAYSNSFPSQSENQNLFVKDLEEPIVTPPQHFSPSLTVSPCTLSLHSIPVTLASFLLLEHAGSLLPQDCAFDVSNPRVLKGMCPYSKFQIFQKSPPQTYPDHSTKISSPTTPIILSPLILLYLSL